MLPREVQVVLFSATYADKVVDYAKKFCPNANELTLQADQLTVDGIKQLYMDCDGEMAKYEVLVKLYGLMTIGSSIIFVKVHYDMELLLRFVLTTVSGEIQP
jgi:ATP-dependent RNA helicase DDX19/DBP5